MPCAHPPVHTVSSHITRAARAMRARRSRGGAALAAGGSACCALAKAVRPTCWASKWQCCAQVETSRVKGEKGGRGGEREQ